MVTDISAMISQLLKAANTIGNVSVTEKRQHLAYGLQRLATARRALVRAGTVAPINVAVERAVHAILIEAHSVSDETAARGMLALAEELRKLRILSSNVMASIANDVVGVPPFA